MKTKFLTTIVALFAMTLSAQAQFDANGHEYVNLGLPSGTMWATCNVGATAPEVMGSYIAWGETEPKDNYRQYKYLDENEAENGILAYTKYNNVIDCLQLEDDAARVNWGGDWRTPSEKNVKELLSYCIITVSRVNNIQVLKVTSRINGNYIIFPTGGYIEGDYHHYYGIDDGTPYWTTDLFCSDVDFDEVDPVTMVVRTKQATIHEKDVDIDVFPGITIIGDNLDDENPLKWWAPFRGNGAQVRPVLTDKFTISDIPDDYFLKESTTIQGTTSVRIKDGTAEVDKNKTIVVYPTYIPKGKRIKSIKVVPVE